MSINRHEELSLLLRRSRLAGLLFLLSCLVVSSVAVREAGNSTLIIPRAVCPQVLRCHCSNGRDPTAVMCRQISHFEIYQLISLYPSLRSLEIDQWAEHTLNLEVLSKLTSLVDLSVKNSELREVIPVGQRWESLKVLDFGSSRLIETEILCNISRSIVHLNLLNLSRTKLFSLEMCLVDASIDVLDASNNELSNASLPQSLISLDLSGNQLEGLTLPDQTQNADISRNPLRNLGNGLLKKIRVLNITGTAFTVLPELDAPTLEEIHFDKNRLIFADLTRWRTPLLKTVSLRESSQLELVYGSLPPTVRHLKLTKADIEDLPREFFSSVNLTTLELESTAWDCHPCRLLWARSVQKQLDPTLCPGVSFNLSACQLGCLGTDSLRRVRYGMHAVLRCACWGDPDPSVEWSFYRPKTLLGRFDPGLNKAFTHDLGEFTRLRGRYEILSNGLLLHSAERDLVERYVCVVRNMHGSAYHVVSMRLDYSHWYSLDILDSVFWGCLLCSFLVCFLSFLLNITWILSRKSILWWIKRAERLSRVRKMVEAMEKYRARQMEALHETYTRRVHNVRENYHHQVEQLRQSYASQAERFRDYRAAQMENVTSHLETIRENYNQQMQRVREYGSRRAESLWESYERQVNRMRTFSLQHRLKLMRQYKVKQRYLNKLLESFQDPHNPEAIRQHEEEVRAALDELKDAPLDEPLSGKSVSSPTKTARTSTFVEAGHDPLSRASSYYSLPEYVLDENGQLRAPIIPNVPFHHREEFSSRPGPSNSNSAEPTPKRGPSSSLSSANHGTQKNEEVELRDFGIGNYGLDETLSRVDHPKDRKSAPTSLPL